MAVAPIPVLLLPLVVLFAVRTITLVLFNQVTSVRAVLAIIPVVVVVMVPIVDSELKTGVLRCCGGHD